MKVALPYLYPGKTSGQGVFEETFAQKLEESGVKTKVFYPTNKELRKIPQVGTILSMASLREYKEELNEFDLIYSTNGTCVALMDKQIKTPVLPVYHSTGFTIYDKIIADSNIDEIDIYEKHREELEPLELVPKQISGRSLQNWGLCGIFAAQNADDIIAVSNSVKNELVDFANADQNKIEVIENGIESFWFDKNVVCKDCDKISLGWGDKPVVIWMGRMGRDELNFKIKGIDRLLEIMDRLPAEKFNKVVVAIVPSEKPEYLKKYSELFRKRGIKFIPNHPYHHLPHLMQKGDIFIMPSRYEGFSLSLVEAMASGLVPISYEIGVAPDAIVDTKNGYLVNSVDEVVEKIYLISKDENLKAKLAHSAMEDVKERFNIEKMISSYLKKFEYIIQN